MQFNVAKQPLIPAFLSLVVLSVVALCNATDGSTWGDLRGGLGAEELPIPLFGVWLQRFQVLHPIFARWIGGVLMLYTGASLGRLTLRYNLYGTGTCLAIPIYGLAMIGTMQGGSYLSAIVISTLLMLSFKNLCLSYRNGFGFDRIFRCSLFLALLLLTEPSTLPLLLLLPFAVRRFRRTTREWIVALGGLLLPIVVVCYLNWALGGSFTAPIRAICQLLTDGSWGAAFVESTIEERIYGGTLLLLNLTAYSFFRTNSYNVSIKARHILLLTGIFLPLCLAVGLFPTDAERLIALLAIPTTLILPVLFIRLHRPIAQTLYPLLIATAIGSLFL